MTLCHKGIEQGSTQIAEVDFAGRTGREACFDWYMSHGAAMVTESPDMDKAADHDSVSVENPFTPAPISALTHKFFDG